MLGPSEVSPPDSSEEDLWLLEVPYSSQEPKYKAEHLKHTHTQWQTSVNGPVMRENETFDFLFWKESQKVHFGYLIYEKNTWGKENMKNHVSIQPSAQCFIY